MNFLRASILYTLVTLLLLINVTVYAQHFNMGTREWSSIKSAGALKTCLPVPPPAPPAARCDTLLSQVDFFYSPSLVGTAFNVKEIRSFVKFAINHNDQNIYAPYTYRLGYEIRGFKQLNATIPTDIIRDTLMINYNPDSTNAYQDIQLRSYYGYYRVEVKVISLYDYTGNYNALIAGSATIPPPVALYDNGTAYPALASMNINWNIEAGMSLQTFDVNMSAATPATMYSSTMSGIKLVARHDAPVTGINMLHVKWDLFTTVAPVPAMYELEWVYSDNYTAGIQDGILKVSKKTNVPYDFRENSTRIITNKTSYDIPLVYKRGYIAYRVRMLRPDSYDYKNTKYSDWSNATDSAAIGSGNGFYEISTPHLSDRSNWNYEASYAEEGKSKQVLGYFDGLLKNRQTLTRFSARPTELIGAEKFYDFEGRVGLQTLPVPVLSHSDFSYIPGFALAANSQQSYKAADIDPLAPSPLQALHSNAAAQAYYSPQNGLLGTAGYGMIKSLPDAEGYPLIQTHYSPDDPGRIRIQGSAGKELQVGKGHETAYYYSDPGQEELNKYMGANIGRAKYYEKVITRDPNKELSFSVLNNEGKPVMTGLMGFPDPANNTTLLNLDGVAATTGPYPFENQFYGNPPFWSGNKRIFNKTFFKESTGGDLKYSLYLQQYRPCQAVGLEMGLPIEYGITFKSEYGSTPQTLIAPTTASPGGGSGAGPVLNSSVAAISINSGVLPLSGIVPGENTINYTASYNPDDVDTAIKRYLRSPLLYTSSSCFKTVDSFLKTEIENLPDNCEDPVTDGGSTECAQYESIMKMQLMPQATYGEYQRQGSNRTIIGNGRSLFAIVGWKSKDPLNPLYPDVAPVDPVNATAFDASVWPSGFIFATTDTPGQKMDLILPYYEPIYAYQHYLPSFAATISYNGDYVALDNNTPVNDLIEMYNSDVAAIMLPIHPEYCEYRKRYCDASNYANELMAIPNIAIGQQLGRYAMSDIVNNDPFKTAYIIQNNVTDGLKFMIYNTTNGAGAINGSSEIEIEYFAYLKTVCDDASNPATCWGAGIINSPGAVVANPSGLAATISNLTQVQKELYYKQLISLYIANRGNQIARYRDQQYACDPMLPLKDANNEVFREDLDEDGNPKDANGPPSYSDIVNGNLLDNIQGITIGTTSPGNQVNDIDEYAKNIIKQLLNCREPSNNNYNIALFTTLLNDLKVKIQENVIFSKDGTWKGGITPSVMNEIILNRGFSIDDLCNPYLVDYSLSAKGLAKPCSQSNNGEFDYCPIIQKLNIENSFMKFPVVDIYEMKYNPSYTPTSGTNTIYANTNNPFEHVLLKSLGYNPMISQNISYSWVMSPSASTIELTFINGSRHVEVLEYIANGELGQQTANGDLLSSYASNPVVSDYYKNYDLLCNCTNGGLTDFKCYDNLSAPNRLKFSAVYVSKEYRGHFANFIATNYIRFIGLDLSDLIESETDTFSLPCIHTCIACNELKDAYKVYQTEVANKYGIKGKGHPFYETSIRSFFNYYFRNRHYSDEYMDFMKGCNLSDSLFLPEYYGYFQASGSANQIASILSTVRSYSATSPAAPPLAGPNPTLAANLDALKYFRYEDAGGTDHLYIDFTSVYKDERLRPFINYMKGWLAANAGGVAWSFNNLNSETAGQPAYSADIFLPGNNTALPSGLSLTGVTVTNENVMVKDATSGPTAIQLTIPFTHHHFELPGTTGSLGVATAWAQLSNELSTALHAAPGIDNYVELSSHESYRNTHGNSLSDKIAYLSYVYNLAPGTTHDNILQSLLASSIQTQVYTVGSVPLKDVAYRHGMNGNPDEPSGTLQLFNHASSPAPTAGIGFLNDILDRAKFKYPIGTFPYYPGIPAIPVPQDNPFYRSASGLMPGPPPVIPVINFASGQYSINTVSRIANNTYTFQVKSAVDGERKYNVHVRVPDYISRKQALRYNLVGSIQPYAMGNSKRYFKALFQNPANPADQFTAIGKTDFDLVATVPDMYEHIMLCDKGDAEDNADSINICYDALVQQAITNAAQHNSQYQDSLYTSLRFAYRQFISTYIDDKLEMANPQMKSAVTLYSYDRAGNLMKTVPPMGVQPMTNTDGVNSYRENGTSNGQPFVPAHTKVTEYKYTSLNQKFYESTPDGGSTAFYYDQAGRMVLSQSSRQVAASKFTYSLYDKQNRPVETGQVIIKPIAPLKPIEPLRDYLTKISNYNYNAVSTDHEYLKALLGGSAREEVIRTTYDTALYVYSTTDNGMSKQENLRSRIAAVASYPRLAANSTGYTGYDVALHYSYDLSGNLKTLTYDMPLLDAERQRYKRIDYDYDLYSGKVTLVSYNRSFADQFYQRYSYDDDNRITLTETSKDGIIWDRDAEYRYYPHGPLARISLGDQRVQGIDFAYTLQGWLKSINGDSPGAQNDMGGDGVGNNAHQADLYRTSIAYFDGDYKPLDATDATGITGTKLLKLPPPAAANRSLYNGNIAGTSSIPGYFPALYTGYRYDKLNRIKAADYEIPDYTSSSPLGGGGNPYGIGGGLGNLYHSDYSYDLDGNLTSLNRYGFKPGTGGVPTGGQVYQMDQLQYKYASGTTINNKLTNFTDAAIHTATSGFSNDLATYNPADAQNVLRMQYDPSGNLVKDLSNGLTSIDWTLYGKAKQIVKDDGHTLGFKYDPLGNRLSKTISTVSGSTGHTVTEYYIRDAGGNELASYRQQQRYSYPDVYEQVLGQSSGNPLFPAGITAVLGNDGGFTSTLLSGTISQLPSFTSTLISSKGAGFYTGASTTVRSTLLEQQPGVIRELNAYDGGLGLKLYPLTEGYNAEPFAPLTAGITEDAELQRCATLLFGNEAVKARYIRWAGLDEGGTYEAAQLGEYLATSIKDWKSEAHGEEDLLKGFLWNDKEEPDPEVYGGAIAALFSDAAYLASPVEAGPVVLPGDPGAGTGGGVATGPLTLDRKLRTRLQGLDPKNNGALIGVVSGYFGELYGADEAGMSALREAVGDEVLLSMVYADSPASYIASLSSINGATPVLLGALNGATGMTPLGVVEALGAFDASLEVLLPTVLSYDRLYLAGHVMYGSSRLGVKEYYPTQYKYEWDAARTVAQNTASLDSSEFSYRRPWYSGVYEGLIAGDQQTPYGHGNAEPLYSSRVTGQKKYELTNHLGNVMAVVTDKVTEAPAVAGGVPGLALKRASLSAAYDYYPFGMQMPGRTTEDGSVHCVPVSRTRYVNTAVTDAAYLNGGTTPLLKVFTGRAAGVNLSYVADDGTGAESLGLSLAPGTETVEVSAGVLLPSLPVGTKGVVVNFTVGAIKEDREVTAVLKRVNDEMELTLARINGNGNIDLSYEGLDGTESLEVVLRTLSNTASIKTLGYSTIVKSAQTYVALSCDTDGVFDASYKFGFNGQMKDNEVAGKGNHNTALFWEYDTRLAWRWNTDPKTNPSISPYSVFNNNPILNNDVLGDILDVATDNGSKGDIKGMVEQKNQKYVKIGENGRVDVDFGDMKQKQVDKLLRKDNGLSLINSLAHAKDANGNDLKFYYSNSPNGISNRTDNGKVYSDLDFPYDNGDNAFGILSMGAGLKKNFFLNASTTEYGADKSGRSVQLYPKDGYDGQVTVFPGEAQHFGIEVDESISTVGGLTKITKTNRKTITNVRSQLIKHELYENMLRTQQKLQYMPAHDKANSDGYSDPIINQFIFKK